MSKKKYAEKIELLRILQTDIWISKKKHINDSSNKTNKNIIFLSSLNKNHEDVIENFTIAAKKKYPKVIFTYLNEIDIISLFGKKNSKKENIYLIFFDNKTSEKISSIINVKESLFVDTFNNNTFIFSQLLAEEVITKLIKKKIWKNFIELTNYE